MGDESKRDNRIAVGWLTEFKTERGSYFKGGGFGAVNILLTAGGCDTFNANGQRVWTLYVVERTDGKVKKPGSVRGGERGLARLNRQ